MISWLEKLGLGLKKSSQKIGGGISGIFTKRKLDAETLEELEELLIASDMGVRTAAAIVGEFTKMRNFRAGDQRKAGGGAGKAFATL